MAIPLFEGSVLGRDESTDALNGPPLFLPQQGEGLRVEIRRVRVETEGRHARHHCLGQLGGVLGLFSTQVACLEEIVGGKRTDQGFIGGGPVEGLHPLGGGGGEGGFVDVVHVVLLDEVDDLADNDNIVGSGGAAHCLYHPSLDHRGHRCPGGGGVPRDGGGGGAGLAGCHHQGEHQERGC